MVTVDKNLGLAPGSGWLPSALLQGLAALAHIAAKAPASHESKVSEPAQNHECCRRAEYLNCFRHDIRPDGRQ